MIILQKENHSCIYTLDTDSQELYYAPIYSDNSINISEFAPVDLFNCEDKEEVLNIQKELINLSK
jgi:hypothetical protein